MAKTTDKSPQSSGGSFGETPKFDRSQLFADVGATGLRAFGGYVREDYLPNLTGRQGATVYREMMDSSPIVGALMFAILGAMRKVEWRTESADDTPAAAEAAEFADSLRFDMDHTWDDFIVEALSMLGYGYAVHEIVYKRRAGPRKFGSKLAASKFDDGMIGWRRLPLRSQDTILKWFFDENGAPMGVTQIPWIGSITDLPMEKLLLFRPTQHKNNPEGRSILRTAYRSYYFVKRLEEGEAIYIERMSGNVVVRVPSSLLDAASAGDSLALATLNAYKNMATRSRTDEQMGILIPSDTYVGNNGPTAIPLFNYEYVTPAGGGAKGLDANTPIVRHKMDILSSVLADFIQMGHTTRGAQNLADTKVDLFLNSIEGWLNSMASVINQHALKRLWDLNGLDADLMPEYVPDMAQQVDLDILSNFILRLSQSGVQIFPDEDLEAYVRDVAGLPDAAEGASWKAKEEEDAGSQEKNPAKTAAKSIIDDFMKGQLRGRKRK